MIGDEETAVLRWSALCRRQITLGFDGKSDQAFAATRGCLRTQAPPHAILIPDCKGIGIVDRMRKHMPERITPMPGSATLDLSPDGGIND